MQTGFQTARMPVLLRRMGLGVVMAGVVGCSTEPGDPGGGPPPPAPVIATVAVTPGVGTVLQGNTTQLVAVARAANGDTIRTASFTWSSDDGTIATVSATGLVTAANVGTTKITATSGTRFGQATITVTAPAPEPAPTIAMLSPASVAAGGPDLVLTITGTGFRPDVRVHWNGAVRPSQYQSATEVRATIWAADRATAGNAAIQVVNPAPGAGASAAVSFPIVPQTVPVAAIALNRSVAYSTATGAVPMTATVRDGAGNVLADRLVTWTSSNQLVAIVTGDGLVQPRGVGEVTITAASEGQSATLALTVATGSTHLILDDGALGLASFDMRLGTVPGVFWTGASGGRAADPSVSPDGRWVAYTVEVGGSRSIAVLDQATRTYVFLSGDGMSDQPAWSPTDSRILFRSRRAGRADVWVINADGSGERNLTAVLPAGWEAGWPAWSPDGSRIVFSASQPNAQPTLFHMRPDGTAILPLLISSHHDTEAAWRFDAVVFTRRMADGTTNLFRVPVGGGVLVQLTHTGQATAPAWSPDGRWIAFANGAAAGGRQDILAVRPFGEEVRPLSLVAQGGGGRNPTWILHQ